MPRITSEGETGTDTDDNPFTKRTLQTEKAKESASLTPTSIESQSAVKLSISQGSSDTKSSPSASNDQAPVKTPPISIPAKSSATISAVSSGVTESVEKSRAERGDSQSSALSSGIKPCERTSSKSAAVVEVKVASPDFDPMK